MLWYVRQPMKFRAVEFKTVIKSLSLGLKCLSCKAALCLHHAVIFSDYFLRECHALSRAKWCSADTRVLGKLGSALGLWSTLGKRSLGKPETVAICSRCSLCSSLGFWKWLLYCELFHLVSTPLEFDTAEINVTLSVMFKLPCVMKVRIPTASVTLTPEEKAHKWVS